MHLENEHLHLGFRVQRWWAELMCCQLVPRGLCCSFWDARPFGRCWLEHTKASGPIPDSLGNKREVCFQELEMTAKGSKTADSEAARESRGCWASWTKALKDQVGWGILSLQPHACVVWAGSLLCDQVLTDAGLPMRRGCVLQPSGRKVWRRPSVHLSARVRLLTSRSLSYFHVQNGRLYVPSCYSILVLPFAFSFSSS